jgi:hypothetical protein
MADFGPTIVLGWQISLDRATVVGNSQHSMRTPNSVGERLDRVGRV